MTPGGYDSFALGAFVAADSVVVMRGPIVVPFSFGPDDIGMDLSPFLGVSTDVTPRSCDMRTVDGLHRVVLGPLKIQGARATTEAALLHGPRVADGRWSPREVAR